MRTLIQRVSFASVTIDGAIKSSIAKGLLIFAGIEENDNTEDIEWLAGKICRLRIFDDSSGVMNLSVQDINGGLMVISQFTLHASVKKGNRPSYIKAARPEIAIPVYENFLKILNKISGLQVCSGEFGADMKINLENDGPVSIFIDTKLKE